jgi:hypothetical protein
MKEVLGIDIGYGDTKTFKSITGKIKFPTWVTKPVRRDDFGPDRQWIFVNGETFVVGKEANGNLGTGICTRSSSFVGSNAWLATLGKALTANKLLPDDMEGLKIVLGLPPGLFTKNEVGRLKKILQDAKISVSMGSEISVFDLSQTQIRIMPQGTGIYYAYLLGLSDAPEEREKTIAVVDLGYYTLDTILFAQGQYIGQKARSVPLGISVLLDDICTEFSKEYGFMVSTQTALDILIHGKVSILQRDYTLQVVDQLFDLYTSQLSSHIDNFFESVGQKQINIGVAAGGGVMIVQRHLRVKSKMVALSNPDMANVIGYWHFGLNSNAD